MDTNHNPQLIFRLLPSPNKQAILQNFYLQKFWKGELFYTVKSTMDSDLTLHKLLTMGRKQQETDLDFTDYLRRECCLMVAAWRAVLLPQCNFIGTGLGKHLNFQHATEGSFYFSFDQGCKKQTNKQIKIQLFCQQPIHFCIQTESILESTASLMLIEKKE